MSEKRFETPKFHLGHPSPRRLLLTGHYDVSRLIVAMVAIFQINGIRRILRELDSNHKMVQTQVHMQLIRKAVSEPCSSAGRVFGNADLLSLIMDYVYDDHTILEQPKATKSPTSSQAPANMRLPFGFRPAHLREALRNSQAARQSRMAVTRWRSRP